MMYFIKLSIIFIFLISPKNFAQNNTLNKDTLIAKEYGNYYKSALEKARDDADNYRKLNANLNSKLETLQRKNMAEKDLSSDLNFIKNSTIYLSLGLLAFGLILILSILYFLFRLQKGFENYAFQTIGLIIVVIAALFLIVTGYDKDQITPIIGLLGTIVGFIFGSNMNVKKDDNNASPKNKTLKMILVVNKT